MDRLRSEVSMVMGDEVHPSREQIRRMPYLGSVITESRCAPLGSTALLTLTYRPSSLSTCSLEQPNSYEDAHSSNRRRARRQLSYPCQTWRARCIFSVRELPGKEYLQRRCVRVPSRAMGEWRAQRCWLGLFSLQWRPTGMSRSRLRTNGGFLYYRKAVTSNPSNLLAGR
jgi:hypothetical protein